MMFSGKLMITGKQIVKQNKSDLQREISHFKRAEVCVCKAFRRIVQEGRKQCKGKQKEE